MERTRFGPRAMFICATACTGTIMLWSKDGSAAVPTTPCTVEPKVRINELYQPDPAGQWYKILNWIDNGTYPNKPGCWATCLISFAPELAGSLCGGTCLCDTSKDGEIKA